MKGLDYKHFKKIRSDEHSTTLRHRDGHELTIAHKPLSDKHLGELSRLPLAEGGRAMYAEAGEVDKAMAPDLKSELPPDQFNQGEIGSKFAQAEKGYVDTGASPLPVPNSDKLASDVAVAAPQAAASLAPQAPPQAPVAPTQPGATSQGLEASQEAPKQAEEASNQDLRAEAKTSSPEQAATDSKASMQQEHQAFAEDLALGHIQPKTYHDLFQDQSTLGKIGAVFGMFLGGIGGGLTGQPNAYISAMDKLIQRDLEAQEKSNTNAQNWYNLSIKNMEAGLEGRKLSLAEKQQARAEAEAKMLETTFHNLKLKAAGNPSDPQVQKANVALAQLYPVVQAKINNIQDLAAAAVAYSKANPLQNLTPAQQSADKEYAKDYVEWVSKDKGNLEKGLNVMEEAIQALEKDPSIAGRGIIRGNLPEGLTSNAVLAQRQRIRNAALPMLKATFPGAVSDSERQELLKSYYNEAADAKTNIAGLKRLSSDARKALEQKNALAEEYQKKGTISSFKPELKTPQAKEDIKVVNGVKYKRGPNGEAVPVK